MMVLRSLLLLLLLGVSVAPAAAVEIDARGSANGDGRYHTEENAVVVDGRIDFDVDIGPFSFGGAYRAYDFGEGSYNPRGIAPIFDIWHRYVEGRSGDLTARGGHYFSTFGRGLVLRGFEDIALEHDTSLDGFIAEYQPGTAGFTGLAGQASERISDIKSNTYRVRGGRLQGWLGSQVSVAVSGLDRSVTRKDEEITLPDSLSEFADYVLGSEAEAWLGPVSVVGEYAYRNGDYYPSLRQGKLDGHGFYLAGTVTPVAAVGVGVVTFLPLVHRAIAARIENDRNSGAIAGARTRPGTAVAGSAILLAPIGRQIDVFAFASNPREGIQDYSRSEKAGYR